MIRRILLVLLFSTSVGHAQSTVARPDAPEREPYRDPLWAGVQGAIVPGSVHMQNDEPRRGTAYLVVAIVLAPFALGVVEFPLLDDPDFSQGIGVLGYAMTAGISAYESAEIAGRLNVENGYDLDLDLSRRDRASERTVRVTLLRARF